MPVKNKGGAPRGNKNAAGHGAPKKNKNAVKHGLYEKLCMDDMTEDEKKLYLSLLDASGHHEELAELRYKYIRIMKSDDHNKHLLKQIISKIRHILINECYLHTENEDKQLKRIEVDEVIKELLKIV